MERIVRTASLHQENGMVRIPLATLASAPGEYPLDTTLLSEMLSGQPEFQAVELFENRSSCRWSRRIRWPNRIRTITPILFSRYKEVQNERKNEEMESRWYEGRHTLTGPVMGQSEIRM